MRARHFASIAALAVFSASTAVAADRGQPQLPAALYGRGLAGLRLGERAQGQNDLAAAEKLASGIAKRFASMGLAP